MIWLVYWHRADVMGGMPCGQADWKLCHARGGGEYVFVYSREKLSGHLEGSKSMLTV